MVRGRATMRSSMRSTRACVVTSSAVVGSSAIKQVGVADQCRGDHHPLQHAARILVGIVAEPLARPGDLDLLEQRHGPRLGFAPSETPGRTARSARTRCVPMVWTGLKADIGSW
jgi:hypothetical protein